MSEEGITYEGYNDWVVWVARDVEIVVDWAQEAAPVMTPEWETYRFYPTQAEAEVAASNLLEKEPKVHAVKVQHITR